LPFRQNRRLRRQSNCPLCRPAALRPLPLRLLVEPPRQRRRLAHVRQQPLRRLLRFPVRPRRPLRLVLALLCPVRRLQRLRRPRLPFQQKVRLRLAPLALSIQFWLLWPWWSASARS
jgi:hypothetical protein